MSEYMEYLNVTVNQENKPVTYKSLARSLKIHANTAKHVLYEFSKMNTNIHAVYCITGTTLQSGQYSIQLVAESELEDTKKKYKNISGIHVYSVTSFKPRDFTLLYAACKDIPRLTLEDRIKCGILRNNTVKFSKEIKPIYRQNKSTPITKAPSLPAINKTTTTETSSTAKRKGTLSFGPSTPKKQAVESKPNVETLAPVAKPVAKPVANKIKKSIVDYSEDIEKRMAKTKIRAEDIFSDEEEEEDEQSKEEEASKEEDTEMEELVMEEPEETNQSNGTVKEEEEEKEEEVEEPTAPAPPGKVKRRVLKKKTTKNARGLLVTEEVWEWETVDADEEDANKTLEKSKPKPKPAVAPSKKGANTKNSAAQTNLFSFFKKQ